MIRGAEPQSRCLNCGVPRTGAFCSACGQKYVDEPMTLRTLFQAFASRVLDLDQGLLYTFRRLAVDPGGVARAYVRGRQKPYVHPLALMVVATAVFLGAVGLTEDIIQREFEALLEGPGPSADESIKAAIDQFVEPYATILFVISCLPIAYGFQFAFRRIAAYTSTETLAMVLFATAQATLYTGIGQLLILVWPSLTGIIIAQLSSLLVFPVLAHAAYGFYRRKLSDVVLAFVVSVVSYVAAIAALLVLGIGFGYLLAHLNLV
jgi:hypothetical protein